MSSDVIVAARLNAKSQISSKFLFKLPIKSQILISPTDKSKLLFARSETQPNYKVKALLLLSHNPRTLLNSSGAIPLQALPKLWPILCQGAGPLDWSGSVIKKIAMMSVPGIVPVTPAASGEVGLRVTQTETNILGSLVKSQQLQVIEKRRLTRCKARYRMAKMLHYQNPVLRALRAPESHSDDEYKDATKKELIVSPKPARSLTLEVIIRDLDTKIEEEKQRTRKKGQKTSITRTTMTEHPSALALKLPRNTEKNIIPLDAIDFTYFNQKLTIRKKAEYMHNDIAMPLRRYIFREDHVGWKLLGSREFDLKYAPVIRALYDLPTQAELDELPDSDLEGDGGLDSDDSLAPTDYGDEQNSEAEVEDAVEDMDEVLGMYQSGIDTGRIIRDWYNTYAEPVVLEKMLAEKKKDCASKKWVLVKLDLKAIKW
ncbi:hypothetical protein C8F01DRAFT_1231524 [Mycena amicta]|nr:hypothetical protein C8F01DRAFT_1231524 [Mycena amicta]